MEIYPVFSSRVEFLLGICHILNLMTTIVLKECIVQLNMCFFSGSGFLLLNILFGYDHFPKDTVADFSWEFLAVAPQKHGMASRPLQASACSSLSGLGTVPCQG